MESLEISINNIGVNLEWSLFYTTLCSYKSQTYISDDIIKFCDRDSLERLSREIAETICKEIPLSRKLIDFIALVNKFQHFKLLLCPKNELDEMLNLFLSNNTLDKMNFLLFKSVVNDNSINKNPHGNFDKLSLIYGTFRAIHGSNMNRFYSILQNGLHLPKADALPGLFGSGIYLTNKINVALHFAQAHCFNCGLFKSHSIKAVAVCEIIKHPTSVVRKKHNKSDGFTFGGDISPEYFLVKDECMVRVTHIIIQSASPISNIESCIYSQPRIKIHQLHIAESFIQFFRRHWLIFLLIIYIVLLLFISFLTGKSVIFSDWDTSDLLNINND